MIGIIGIRTNMGRGEGYNNGFNCSKCDKHLYQTLDGGTVCYECLHPKKVKSSVLQEWVQELPFMQQSVLISAVRGPDGMVKNHPSKMLCRWFRRCVLLSAFDKKALTNPYEAGGGSYTGPSVSQDTFNPDRWEEAMDGRVKEYLDNIDDLPFHFHLHLLHAIEIVGYKHSDERIREWWYKTYCRLAHDMHLVTEDKGSLDARLNDDESAWRKDASRFKK